MADHSEHKKRTIEGIALESMGEGIWHVVGAPKTCIFMKHRPVQMGLRGRRYTLNRWTTPPMSRTDDAHGPPTYGSLRQAVRVWKEWKEKRDDQTVEEVVDGARQSDAS